MNRHVKTLGLLVTLSSLAFGQQAWRTYKGQSWNFVVAHPLRSISTGPEAQDQQSETKADDKHLSKKEKKELKKQRKEEEKRRKKEAKEQEKQLRDQQKRAIKEQAEEQKREAKEQEKQLRDQQKRAAERQAKEQKEELKKGKNEVAQAQKEENKREHKEVSKETEKAQKRERRSEERAVASSAKGDRYTIPVSYGATPALLQAQRNVSRSIYSQMPNSHVIVVVNKANQLVLRGSAPTPSFKRRLLGLAMSAAGGYGVVDQLAANMVGSAAGGVTSAAIGGVADLIHGSGSRPDNSSPYDQQGPPPENGYGSPSAYRRPPDDNGPPPADSYSSSNTPSTNNGYGARGANASSNNGLMPGSNACVNVSNIHQVLLTGQTASRLDRSRLAQFALQLAGTNATVLDQLATRANGSLEGTINPQEDLPETILNANALTGLVTPGSVVCVNADSDNALLLTGTVGSSAELASVERSLQALVGNARLVDQLTTGKLDDTQARGAVSPATTRNTARPGGSEVEQALHSIPRLSNVDAEVSGGTVRLSGSVDNLEDAQVAQEIARQYAPGRSVIDALTVTRREQAIQ